MTDDTQLEQEFRDGLRRAAERAEVGVPLAERAHAGARTRRRRRWAVVGAVAVVVAVAGVTAVVQTGDGPGSSGRHTATQPTFAPVTDWRPETWHGLTVDVPADWGWGTAPIRLSGDDQAHFCGSPGAYVVVGGRHPEPATSDTPWVGRPVMLSDACGADLGGDPPAAPYVWLGADVEPGTVDLGDGYTQETVEAFGTTLTVASQDPALRQHVLDSARATTDCEARLPSRPAVVGMPIEGLDPVHSAQVCAYQEGDNGYDLVYAAALDEATAQRLYAGEGLGTKSEQEFCASKFHEYVRITFSGKDAMGTAELTADWVVDPGCQQVEIGPGYVLPLKASGMAAFSRNGLPAVLRSFIGMLG
jgi:hypothetical protein